MARLKNTPPLAQDIRSAILEAALQLFSTKGFFNTSVHDIKDAAGISVGSVYNYFANKEEIARALYRDLLDQLTAVVQEASDTYSTTYEQGRSIVDRLFQLAETRPHVMEFALTAKHREFMPEETSICSSWPFSTMRNLVRTGIERQELRPMDPAVAAACVFGPCLRLITLRLEGILHVPLQDCLDEVWESAWRSVKCE